MMQSRERQLGVLMVLVGLALLLAVLGYLPGAAFLMIFGLGFCAVYGILGGRNSYGNVGFLIPGLILLAVGSFAGLDELVADINPAYFFLFLAAAFLGVALIHTLSFRGADPGERHWPLYPAAGLVLLGTVILAQDSLGVSWAALDAINYLWVIALIGAGLWLTLRPRRENV